MEHSFTRSTRTSSIPVSSPWVGCSCPRAISLPCPSHGRVALQVCLDYVLWHVVEWTREVDTAIVAGNANPVNMAMKCARSASLKRHFSLSLRGQSLHCETGFHMQIWYGLECCSESTAMGVSFPTRLPYLEIIAPGCVAVNRMFDMAVVLPTLGQGDQQGPLEFDGTGGKRCVAVRSWQNCG